MKKIIILSAIFVLIFSCNKESKATTEETTVETTSESDPEIVQDSMAFDIEANSESTFNKSMVESVSKFELVESKSNDYALPKLELKDNLCDNLSSLKLKDLTSGAKFEIYHITKDNKASLSGFGFEGSFSDNETIIIKDYVRTKNISCNGKTQKVGIGLRCFIHVTSKKYKGGANLPYLAANVQLNKATANYKIVSLGFGISGDVFASIKSSGSYDVNGFGEVEKAFDKIMSSLTDKNDMVIDPVPLP